MKIKNLLQIISLISQVIFAASNTESSNEIISNDKLISMLDTSNESMGKIVNIYKEGDKREAIEKLANYFKNKMASSYFFNWENIDERFKYYTEIYHDRINGHQRRKTEHLSLFSADTKWILPMIGLNGEEINAYKLRHLARSHKMIDIGFCYYIEDKNIAYKNYFVEQVRSLNNAYVKKEYETDGNDVFEYFRSGYRVFNWLFTHNLFLASNDYSSDDQILLIKTFLYHGVDLYEKTKKYNDGNHHTKGLMALSLISILFNEFHESDSWLNHSIDFLTKHLMQEINDDGFQFERSVHYHIGDIDNYFYVYYLAKLNQIEISDEFKQRFKSMFDALIKIALPNGKLPVLQDDTDEPWAEINQMHSPMYLGSLLFQDSKYKYFSKEEPSSGKYWFLRTEDIKAYEKIKRQSPQSGSASLDETGYYAMRKSWDKDDPAMIISAGLSNKKPDHQHGDMLGLYGYANDQVILPNYQVRYFLEDYLFFKNSFVKNVALIDSIPHGQDWKGNRGGSGFGKFKKLPNPKTICWVNNDVYDVFVGTHDAYSSLGVEYYRKVLFIKDGFWIVKDEFLSKGNHNYQQVWQGHFSLERNNQLRTTFSNGSGLDIIQLDEGEYQYSFDSFRGKGNVVISNQSEGDFNFTTILYPFAHFEERGIISDQLDLPLSNNWAINSMQLCGDNLTITAEYIISNGTTFIMFNVLSFILHDRNIIGKTKGDYIIEFDDMEIKIISLNYIENDITFNDTLEVKVGNDFQKGNKLVFEPGKIYLIQQGN